MYASRSNGLNMEGHFVATGSRVSINRVPVEQSILLNNIFSCQELEIKRKVNNRRSHLCNYNITERSERLYIEIYKLKWLKVFTSGSYYPKI